MENLAQKLEGEPLVSDLAKVFSQVHYLRQIPELFQTGASPLEHFLNEGWKNLFSPHPLFETAFYLSRYPEVAKAGVNPLVHFMTEGWKQNYQPHPLFDVQFYRRQYPLVVDNPLLHFLKWGFVHKYHPHPLFNTHYYVRQCQPKESKARRQNPLVHYLQDGWRSGLSPNPIFDPAYYKASNADLDFQNQDPFTHFVTVGWKEGRNPSPLFDLRTYLSAKSTLNSDNENPVRDFYRTADGLNRRPESARDLGFYTSVYFDLIVNPAMTEGFMKPLRGPSLRPKRLKKLLFLHVPKTAGTSLNFFLFRQYFRGEFLFMYSEYARYWNTDGNFAKQFRTHQDQIHGVSGHFSYGFHQLLGTPSTYLTFLRDPVDRVISQFDHYARDPSGVLYSDIKKGLTLYDILEEKRFSDFNNQMTRFIAGWRTEVLPEFTGWHNSKEFLKVAMNNIEKDFVMVGTDENLVRHVRDLGAVMGWRPFRLERHNEGRADFHRILRRDVDLVKRIREANELDQELFSHFRENPWVNFEHLT